MFLGFIYLFLLTKIMGVVKNKNIMTTSFIQNYLAFFVNELILDTLFYKFDLKIMNPKPFFFYFIIL
jgi:uncharacterized membrane protein